MKKNMPKVASLDKKRKEKEKEKDQKALDKVLTYAKTLKW